MHPCEVRIAPPRPVRAVVALAVIGQAVLALGLVLAGWGWPAWAAFLGSCVTAYGALSSGATATGAGDLVVRDVRRIRRVRREEVDSVVVGGSRRLWTDAVLVVLRDGERLPIAATALPFCGRRRAGQAAALAAWVRADGRPPPWWEARPPPPGPAASRDTR